MLHKLLLTFFLLTSIGIAHDETSLRKAVFDCSAKELSFIASRLRLIERTSQDFSQNKEKSDFVLTIHSHCTPIVAQEALFFYTPNKAKLIENIQAQLHTLIYTYNVDIRVCEIALNAFDIDKEDLIDGVTTTPNSFMDVIRLQNKGYALFPLL